MNSVFLKIPTTRADRGSMATTTYAFLVTYERTNGRKTIQGVRFGHSQAEVTETLQRDLDRDEPQPWTVVDARELTRDEAKARGVPYRVIQ